MDASWVTRSRRSSLGLEEVVLLHAVHASDRPVGVEQKRRGAFATNSLIKASREGASALQ
jgi:hypothetical protein